jgi:hypothetical protein
MGTHNNNIGVADMNNVTDITPKLIEKQNKQAAKSFVAKMDCKGEAYYELMALMAQLEKKHD